MSLIKKIFKSAFGISGTILITVGLGLTITGATTFSISQKEVVAFDNKTTGQKEYVGTGTKDWFVGYDQNKKPLENWPTDEKRNNLMEMTGKLGDKRAAIKETLAVPLFLDNSGVTKEVLESMLKNDTLNKMGLGFVIVGPVSFVAGSSLTYLAFKSKK
ncbi:MAG: hypothetical protein ACRC4M_05295 [Mycoplasma sp.]